MATSLSSDESLPNGEEGIELTNDGAGQLRRSVQAAVSAFICSKPTKVPGPNIFHALLILGPRIVERHSWIPHDATREAVALDGRYRPAM